MDRRALTVFLAGGSGLVAAYFAVPDDSIQTWLYQSVGLVAAGAVAIGIRRHRPAHPVAWWLLALGLLLWSAGDAVWTWYELTVGEAPLVSVADALYLLAYPAITASAMVMVRARRPGRDVEGLIDALILGSAGAVVAWAGLVQPLLGEPATGIPERLVTAAYPVADVVVLVVLARLVLAPGAMSPAFLLLVAGLAATLVGDVVYLVQVHQDTYVTPSWVDANWLVGYLLLAGASLDPSMPTLTAPGRRERPELGKVRLVLLGAALLSVPVVSALAGTTVGDRWLLTGCSTAVVLLVLWRMAVVMGAKEEQLAERQRAEAELAVRAMTDPLTGLANRDAFVATVDAALARARRLGRTVGVLFLDLDHFKVVNDSLGHHAGDDVLRVVADRLRSALRDGDTLARFGGDEFTVLCESMGDRHDLQAVADRLTEVASTPVTVGDRQLSMGVSIGIALAPGGDGDASALLRDADTAMYQAKARGRNTCIIFDDGLRERAMRRLDLESRLRQAVDRDELRLLYQPEIELETGRIFGVEALLRWEHPERGLLTPAEFIGVAEDTGVILDIGAWVLETACRQARAWHDLVTEEAPVPVAVNLSSRQLGDPRLVDRIERVLRDVGLEPSSLFVEITESALMFDADEALMALNALRDLGISVAVDDFGTGYFSLSHLKRFPIDIVKIDREFVQGLDRDEADTAIVGATVSLAHGLGMVAVAEGAETPEQVAALRTMGCDVAQGFFYARPSAADDLHELLLAGGWRRQRRAGQPPPVLPAGF